MRHGNNNKAQHLNHLLHLLADLHQEQEQQEQSQKGVLNLFDVSNYSHLESGHSRILAFLIDSNEQHRDPEFGKEFIRRLKTLPRAKHLREGSTLSVTTEKWITEKRRVDILIESDFFILVIENKIYAEDDPLQLYDYYDWLKEKAKQENKQHALLYLTLFGDEPYECSLSGDGSPDRVVDKHLVEELRDSLVLLSYTDNILHWLQFVKKRVSSKKKLLTSAFTQYIDTLQGLCQKRERDKMNFLAIANAVYTHHKKDTKEPSFEVLQRYTQISESLEGSYLALLFITFLKDLSESLCDELRNIGQCASKVMFTHYQDPYTLDDEEKWEKSILTDLENIGIVVKVDDNASLILELDNFQKQNIYFGIILYDEKTDEEYSLRGDHKPQKGESGMWIEYVRVDNLLEKIRHSFKNAKRDATKLFMDELVPKGNSQKQ